MSYIFRYLIICLAFCFASLAASAKQIEIKEIALNNTVLEVNHDSASDLKFKKRIYENPPRLVFDIIDAHLGNKSFVYNLPTGLDVTRARVAQFDENTVRVVTEATTVTALEKVNIENIGKTLFFRYAINDVVIQDFGFEDGNMRITADGALVPRSIMLDNPERLVLDLIGAKLKSPSQAKVYQNGTEEMKVTQFDSSIVRVVFTGRNTHKREVRISNNEMQVLVLGEGNEKEEQFKVDNKVLSIKLQRNTKEEVVYAVESLKNLDYKFLKLHNPERLVVDLIGLDYDDALGAEQIPETEFVQDLRFGLATLGKPVTRIVFDMKTKNVIEEFKESNGSKTLLIRMIGVSADKVKDGIEIEAAQKSAGTVVVLDAGHGGYDSGAVYGGYNEKDITLDITRKVQEYLDAAGINVYMVRSEDRFISLAERVEVSNAVDPKIFVSIHVNALITNPEMQGLQSYYYSTTGKQLAAVIHKQLLTDVKMPDQRIRHANFWVTKFTKAPSVLLELGFMTNVAERTKLVKDSYQNDLAKSVARGIINYLEGL
ncbi:MAG: N-acetylmuramoyl-L-alanine amidase [Cyanobacteria bacterium]|nr:N-acetylmuramoyl-L-alanine amidase [Cyanobacteriota bacterium]MDA1020975.1 N-acetylmuramoyl-L-alanine amidase [Cyanobacteriota bacterium]